MAMRARRGDHLCANHDRAARRRPLAALATLSCAAIAGALASGLTIAEAPDLDSQSDDAGAPAISQYGHPSPQFDRAEHHLVGTGPIEGEQSDERSAERGVLGESVVFSQETVEDDEGVGPLFLLAASASCPFGSAAADDFTLDQSNFITRITWEGVYFGSAADFPEPGGDFKITIYEDNGAGNVGDIVRHISSPPISRALNPRLPLFLVHPVYTFSAPVDPPLLIEGGKRYWISINGNPAATFGPTFAWMVSDQGNALDTPEFDQPLVNSAIACADLPEVPFVPGGALGFDADLAFALHTACAPDDCDCDGVSDSVAISSGLSADCNANGVPDECDIAYGVSTDCNGNGVPDECEIIQQVFAHSGKLAPIGREASVEFTLPDPPPATGDVIISVAARADLSAADEYLDVFLNGQSIARLFQSGGSDCPDVDDAAQIVISGPEFNSMTFSQDAVFTVEGSIKTNPTLCTSELPYVILAIDYLRSDNRDCNNNGVLDSCDIASGAATDCNGDGIPDECQIEAVVNIDSGPLGPFGAGSPQIFQVGEAPYALDEVAIHVTMRADLSSNSEYVDIYFNGFYLTRIFQVTGEDCTGQPLETTIILDAQQYNTITESGAAVIEFRASNSVDPELCVAGSFVQASIECLARGAGDCNRNLIPDSCEIAMGLTVDRNNNGLPDTCEFTADFDGDGDVDASDLATLLGLWGHPGPAGDLDASGAVGAADLAILLSQFNGAI